jgi:KTSC domain
MIGAMVDAVKLLGMVGQSAEGEGLSSLLSMDLPLPVKRSSCIRSATYNIADGDLTITFTGGNSVDYEDISIITVIRFLTADSLGGFYNEQIKGK